MTPDLDLLRVADMELADVQRNAREYRSKRMDFCIDDSIHNARECIALYLRQYEAKAERPPTPAKEATR